MALNTPKRIKTLKTFASSPGSECGAVWRDYVEGSVSPASSCDSPEFRHGGGGALNLYGQDGRENRRGRPRSEALTTLMIEGSTSPSAIKCSYCNRVFPREKSLQAHLRTHTGERPYTCDYPGCTRAFTQSGQLKTHQRLHTGERPFICSAPTCQMRFTHANRHCPEHPYDQLKRCDDFVIQAVTEQNHEVIKWLEKYKMEKEDKTPTRKTPKRTKQLCDTSNVCTTDRNENFNIGANDKEFPVTPSNPYKSRKGLMVELDMNAGLEASPVASTKIKPTPKVIQWQEPLSQEDDSADELDLPARSTFNPKKRWLREAWQEDLAKPLEPIVNMHLNENIQLQSATPVPQAPPPPSELTKKQINPNQMRPTVLMVASKDKTMPLVDINQHSNRSDSVQLTTSHPNGCYSNAVQTARKESIISTSASSSTPPSRTESASQNRDPPAAVESQGKNRKWLGALALMELATFDNATQTSPPSSSFVGPSASADCPGQNKNGPVTYHASSYMEL